MEADRRRAGMFVGNGLISWEGLAHLFCLFFFVGWLVISSGISELLKANHYSCHLKSKC